MTEYRGLSVKALGELRRSLGENATYAVSKNTLTTIAAREAGVDGIEAQLVGPTAIAFIQGDPVAVAKGLRDFGRTNPLLVIKGGVLEGKAMSPDEVRRLADLESREVLLSKEGDYVLWEPGVPHLWQAETPAVVVTVRWPSVPGDSRDVGDG